MFNHVDISGVNDETIIEKRFNSHYVAAKKDAARIFEEKGLINSVTAERGCLYCDSGE